ncbi:alpha/beta hydrolase [Streptomyces sp. NPDC005373]|uniref:alpha/beta fold hydrolase n=1 Tax=Streptomyces sp. NPDC005373 TaxID=3156879 RepID=UPI0033B928AE
MTARDLTLSAKPHITPLHERPEVAVELLGTWNRIVHGPRFGHRILEAGDPGKPPLILLHGVGGHAECWARNLAALGRHFHVVAADMLFHGYSDTEPWDDANWVTLMAEGVVDLMDAMGWDTAHVQGESLGGHVTFELGRRFPERCRRLVLNTGLPRVEVLDQDLAARSAARKARSRLGGLSHDVVRNPTFETMRERMRWLVHEADSMTDEMVRIRLGLYQDPRINPAMRRVYRIDSGGKLPLPVRTEEELSRFEPEVLVFWSEHNPDWSVEHARYVADRMPRSWFYVMADAGHWPQWEKPEEHDQVLVDFLLMEEGSR